MKLLGLGHRVISWVWVRGGGGLPGEGFRSVSDASLELGADGLGDQRKGVRVWGLFVCLACLTLCLTF